MEVAALDTFKINVATSLYTALDSKPQIPNLLIAQLAVI